MRCFMSSILVTGATGKQGGAVARALFRDGHTVHALVRDDTSDRAKRLAEIGVVLIEGDLDNRDEVVGACRGCEFVFSVQNGWDPSVGFDGEVRQAENLEIAARRANVRALIQSTMAAGEHVDHVRHFQCKRDIERLLHRSDVPVVFVGTVYFMENFLDPKTGGRMTFPTLKGSLRPATKMHLMSYHDIGPVAARVIREPDRFIGRRLDLAGDELSVGEMKMTYERVSGQRAKRYAFPHWLLRLVSPDFAAQLRWQNEHGFNVSVPDARSEFPELTSFTEFLSREQVTGL